jgi:hypothetical protein
LVGHQGHWQASQACDTNGNNVPQRYIFHGCPPLQALTITQVLHKVG